MLTIYNDDCFTVFKQISTSYADAIITDPPYGINFESNSWDSNLDFIDQFISESFRVLKPNGVLVMFTGWSSLQYILPRLSPFKLRNIICYDRIKGRGAKRNFVSTREEILFLTKGDQYTFNVLQSTIKKKTGGMGAKNGKEYRTLSNVWSDISPIVPWSKERVAHPTQKPIQLMKRIVSVFTNETNIVIDPFMGSGTTGVACSSMNRKFIGIEVDKTYFDIAQNRIGSCDVTLNS